MARKPRRSPGGIAYHVMNRTWGKIDLFEDEADYAAFERVLGEALGREPGVRLCAYCLMPNHFHLVLWPEREPTAVGGGRLSRFMQWLQMTHAQRWHAHRHSGGRGHLYQSRFRSFPVQRDAHFLGVCRYVERNPLRANLAKAAQDWRWSSLWAREHAAGPATEGAPPERLTAAAVRAWPIDRPVDWLARVNRAQDPAELAAIHAARDRGRPYGDDRWSARTAATLGIESALRPRGRPRKRPKE